MGKYDDLSREQLIELLTKRDRTKKLGLVWERDEIEADNAVDANFVAAAIISELSDKPAPWRNMVIEGDNYDALRWLRMSMVGQVKCIYIDPPYNTGATTWVYNDRYLNPEDSYRQSTWLEFMYRRLALARDLLAPSGVLLVSINDEQRARLEMLMDEVLPGMRLGCFVWRTRKGGYDSGNFSKDHDFVLVYRNANFEFAGSAKQRDDYSNPDNDERGNWTDDPLQQPKTYKQRKNGVYLIEDEDTGIFYPPNPNRVWSVGRKGDKGLTGPSIEELIKEKLIIFKRKGEYIEYQSIDELLNAIDAGSAHKFARRDLPNIEEWVGKKIGLGSVRIKKFIKDKTEEPNPLSSMLDGINSEESYSEEVGQTAEGTRQIRSIFGESVFDYPKPVSLIKLLIEQSTRPGDIILDFFAGSGTTAQAVMELNEEDGGDRRFVLVSSTEATIEEPGKNICRDVTAERVRRLNSSKDKKFADVTAEFAYLRCREIEFEDLDQDISPPEVWTALETLHRLPLTLYAFSAWQEHKTENQTLIFADRVGTELLDHLRGVVARRENAFVYTWAPGQITSVLGGALDVRSVRTELVGRFRQ